VPILNNKSWRYPITPSGRASFLDIVTEPSHRIAGDMTIISFDADPAAVRDYTPEPLALDGSGRMYLFNYEGWHYSDLMHTEFVSEKRLQYAESYVMVPCTLDGTRYYYMLYSWVNRDWLAYLGRHAGMPHKIADVQFSHFHGADAQYAGLAAGVRWSACVECLGLVLRASISFEREYAAQEMSVPFDSANPKHVGRRMFWDVCHSRPLLDDLVAHWGDDLATGAIWGGPATLTFHDAENEEVLPFQPLRVHEGVQFPLRFTHATSPPVVLHRFGD